MSSLFPDLDIDNLEPLGTFIGDRLGIVYCAISAIWVIIVAILSIIMYINREDVAIMLRSMPLTLTTVWVATVIIVFNTMQYPMNGVIPCKVEFWIYSLLFPLSVVLLQVKNTRLYTLFVKSVNAYLNRNKREITIAPNKVSGYMKHLGIYVMIFHLIATALIYLFSTRFNPLGIIRGSNENNKNIACHFGWEWYPKHFGLIAYTYLIGPALIYSLQKVEDTHHMKMEILATILTSWASLPIFIISYTYFNKVNIVFPPLIWFNLSMMSICIICFAFPFYEMLSTRKMRVIEDKKNRNNFINVSDAKISREFADVLCDPSEFEKFAAFTVKDLSIENALFFQKAVSWRTRACNFYGIDTKTNKKLIKKTVTKPKSDTKDNNQDQGVELHGKSSLIDSNESLRAYSIQTSTLEATQFPKFIESGLNAKLPILNSNNTVHNNTDNMASSAPNNVYNYQVFPQYISSLPYNEVFTDDSGNPIAKIPYRTASDNNFQYKGPLRIETKESIFLECERLVKEFINHDSPLSLNIVSSTRKSINNALKYGLNYQIVFIFDEAITEVIELMYNNSYIKYVLAKKNKNKHNIHLFRNTK